MKSSFGYYIINMQKLFSIYLSTCLMLCIITACSSSTVEDIPTQEEPQTAIGFNAKVNTRALADVDDVKNDGFSVWGGYEGANVFSGTQVTMSGNTWGYDDPKYWILNKEYTFFAAYPQSVNVTANNGTYELSVQTPATADLDILTASAYTDTNESNFSPVVDLQFKHVLTRVNIKIGQDFETNENDNFTVTKVTLTGIKTSGTYQVTNSGNAFTSTWTLWNTTTSFERTFSTDEQKFIRKQERQILSVWGDDGLLLIPQEIASAAVKIRIDYLFSLYKSTNEPTAGYVEAYLPASVDLWQSGKMITYSTAISNKNVITFLAPEVEPWGTLQTGGTIIIK